MTIGRHVLGILAIAAAARWIRAAWLQRSGDRGIVAPYPNEWGVRTAPLGRSELRLALEEERAIARRIAELRFDSELPAGAPSALPAAGGVLAGPASGRILLGGDVPDPQPMPAGPTASEALAGADEFLPHLIRARDAIERIADRGHAAGLLNGDRELVGIAIRLTIAAVQLDSAIASIELILYDGPGR